MSSRIESSEVAHRTLSNAGVIGALHAVDAIRLDVEVTPLIPAPLSTMYDILAGVAALITVFNDMNIFIISTSESKPLLNCIWSLIGSVIVSTITGGVLSILVCVLDC